MHNVSSHCIERSPSRAGHRRPPLTRTNATFNAFPDLPPIRITTCPVLDPSSSDGESSPGSSDSEEDIKVDLTPLCPPSPPSPQSPNSECSSPLYSPTEEYDWEYNHDSFPPPPISLKPPATTWPATPSPQSLLKPPQGSHYGISHNALFDRKALLWYRRLLAWSTYDDCCRELNTYQGQAGPDGVHTTIFYPPRPALPPSRAFPWISANGRFLPPTDPVRIQPINNSPTPSTRRQNEHLYSRPIYPRMGNLADLRDPACESQDREFYDIPAHKLGRFVYINEMHALREVAQAFNRPTATHLRLPSPLLCAPESPASVYSQDGTFAASQSPYLAQADSCATVPLETGWKARWEAISQFFPATPPPSPRFPQFLPAWFEPPSLSPPPTEPLDAHILESVSVEDASVQADADSDGDINKLAQVSTRVPFGNSAPGSALAPGPVAVHLPAPTARPPPTLACANASPPPRPPTPFARARASSNLAAMVPSPRTAKGTTAGERDEVPVVILPSRSLTSVPKTLAHELDRARTESSDVGREDGEVGDEDAVRFTIARPPSRCGKRFKFVVHDGR